MDTALIIVDVQNDFMPGGGLAVPGGNEVVSEVNKLIQIANERNWFIVATQDWHPKDHGSFASNNNAAPFTMGELDGLPQVMWTDHCIQGTNGAEFHPDLNTEKIELIVPKGTNKNVDSYSGFFDNARRFDTSLNGTLKNLGIKTVYICGLARDYCVKFTALDAASLGYETYVIEDATRGVNFPEGSNDQATQELLDAKVKLTFVKDI